jgi:hypothetical protein
MFKLNNNYTHKFIDCKKIYTITHNSQSKILYKQFLSIQYKPDLYNTNNNVLIGFNNETYTKEYLKDINKNYSKNHAELFKIDLDEFKYIGALMNIPVVIILNTKYTIYNNEYEIYYHYKNKYEIMDNFYEQNYKL